MATLEHEVFGSNEIDRVDVVEPAEETLRHLHVVPDGQEADEQTVEPPEFVINETQWDGNKVGIWAEAQDGTTVIAMDLSFHNDGSLVRIDDLDFEEDRDSIEVLRAFEEVNAHLAGNGTVRQIEAIPKGKMSLEFQLRAFQPDNHIKFISWGTVTEARLSPSKRTLARSKQRLKEGGFVAVVSEKIPYIEQD